MSSSDILYRKATIGDASVILDLVRELAVYEKLAHEVTAKEKDICDLFRQGENRFFFFLAELNGDAVGLCIGHYTLSTFLGKAGLYIEDVFVRESFRGLGIGKEFFRMIAAKAIEENCGRVEWSVLDWNEPSIKFYEKMGAKSQSEWIKYRLDNESLRTMAA